MNDHTEQVPFRNDFGDVNIGWNAGLPDENRPYFVECWAADGITMLTIFVSTIEIEDRTPDELTGRILETGYFRFADEGYQTAETMTFTNPEGNTFFSLNIAAGVGDGPALIDGAQIYPWSALNEYNRAASEG